MNGFLDHYHLERGRGNVKDGGGVDVCECVKGKKDGNERGHRGDGVSGR